VFRIVGLAVLVFRGDRAKDAELLVLRHKNAVPRHRVGQVRYEPADRVWVAALAWLVPRRRRAEIFLWVPRTQSTALTSRVARSVLRRDDQRSCCAARILERQG
jgi:hypothetical protein